MGVCELRGVEKLMVIGEFGRTLVAPGLGVTEETTTLVLAAVVESFEVRLAVLVPRRLGTTTIPTAAKITTRTPTPNSTTFF
jgi:hypothetical protein